MILKGGKVKAKRIVPVTYLVRARNARKGVLNGRAYLERLADLGVRRTAADFDPLRRELEGLFEQGLRSQSAAEATEEPSKLKKAAKKKVGGGWQ